MNESYPYPAAKLPVEVENQVRDALAAKDVTLIAARTRGSQRSLRVVVRWDPTSADAIDFFRTLREEWEYMTEKPSYYNQDNYDRRVGSENLHEISGDLNDDAFLAFAAGHMTARGSRVATSAIMQLCVKSEDPRVDWSEIPVTVVPIHPGELLELHQSMKPLEALRYPNF